MQTRVCNICHIEKPITEYYKDKTRKDGIERRCKKCDTLKQKIFRQKPEVKKRNQIRAAEWRKNNPLKWEYVYRKSNPKNTIKQRLLYNSDPVFRQKCKERQQIALNNLDNWYVRLLLRRQSKDILNGTDIPIELINMKKQCITLKREIKNKII